jgi:5'-3' exonuclease
MIDLTSPLLLIDLGYALFYRYSATQVWYKHSHPEEKAGLTKDYKWHENEEFITKMKKMFMVDILELAKKHKIPKTNIIIAEDCRLKDNWRTKLFNDYKGQRAEERERNDWQGAQAFEIIYKDVIPDMINIHGVHLIKSPSVEADDIISQIVITNNTNTTTNTATKAKTKMIIVASDNDYFQILDDNVDLINMKGVSQKEKMKYSPFAHLVEKIIKGDVSDNIPPCLFNKKWLPTELKTRSKDDFVKPNKAILEYYLKNPEKLEEDIKNVSDKSKEEYIKGYTENKRLIAFSELPKEYVTEIIKAFNAL